ncbi:FAD/NAD(P)-binding domain-containing protein [Gonapodya prolifera JEL478]|uniref:FAD/NAD(P)-binding domain-containing protein n=1 Tax=Gonapodya prolifera (strain JEL478) TaxID=1344416 RepID=A0A139A6K3_GONPJ|nr:FAD/NAD(P)-binding domain-containing protein [Gonapodya prolifera JEL478]|eukprot:KXS12391.1 FAD/NAD(P)-binding domain-containing protein [Gonapodya prolifera JEL478]
MPTALIVGGGLGGLAAAIGLRREGWTTVILESAHQINEVGAGIQLPANSGRILVKWGLREKIEKVACRPVTTRYWRYDNAAPLSKWLYPPEELTGAPYWNIHRGDYQKLLLAEALSPVLSSPVPNPGPPLTTFTNTTVSYVDCETASVKTADGRSFSGDVLIGADGVRSVVKVAVTGEPDHAKPSGDQAFRFLIPVEKVKEHRELDFVLDRAVNNHLGPDAHIVHYPVHGYRIINVICVSRDTGLTQESWNQQGSREEVLKAFDGWSPEILKLLSLPDKYLKWQLIKREELPTWVRGKTALLGDACHAMVPYLAQGAAQAVEDGAALARALGSGLPVDVALRAYENVRKPRTTAVMSGADDARTSYHMHDGVPQMKRDNAFKKGWGKGSISPHWAYDAEGEMNKHLNELISRDGTPENAPRPHARI